MDAQENGCKNVPTMQFPLLGSKEGPQEGKAEKEIRRQKNREVQKRYRERHPERYREKRRAISKRYYQKNRGKIYAYSQAWKKRNPEREKRTRRKLYLKHREKRRAYGKYWNAKNCDRLRQKNKEYGQKARDQAFQAYGGPICKCCGEVEVRFLSLDHVNNDGAEHRRKDYSSGKGLHYWVRKMGYPSGFQVLCMQCNFAKGKYGICPHREIKTPVDLFLETV